MEEQIVFIYDGECPFCNHFAELLELKSGLQNIHIKNARENLKELKDLYQKGYDIDQGAILIKGKEIMHGSYAINWICSQIKEPSDSLLQLISMTFSSKKRTDLVFPLLVRARRALLIIRGISTKLIFSN